MNTELILISCAGVLIVILNEPLGEALYRARLGMGDRDYGVWSYRGPLIFLGLLLTCLSFFAE